MIRLGGRGSMAGVDFRLRALEVDQPPAPPPAYRRVVLTLEDCLALCELTEDEVLAIAGHERIPELAATELGHYLVRTPEGELAIKEMIRADIAAALAAGDRMRALALKLVLRDFIVKHPRCEARHRAALRGLERRSS
jgi:hypothetical protein